MKTWVLLLAGLLVVSTIPCQAKSAAPLFAAPEFSPALIDRIDVFVIDPSNDVANNSECINGAKIGTGLDVGGAANSLAKRGYNKAGRRPDTRFYNAPITLSEAMLSNPSKEWLQDLGDRKYSNKKGEVPPPGRWIMIITIDELGSRENSIKGVGRASLSMYLYDRNQATLLWHDQAQTEHMWGGLLGNLVQKGAIKQQTCGFLVHSMD